MELSHRMSFRKKPQTPEKGLRMQGSARLELTEHEQLLIITLLEEGIPELQEEIRHTDNRRYRDTLKEKKNASLALLTKLRQIPALQ
jgi:hypothetical protein